MRKELSSPLCIFLLLIASCLTLTSARAPRVLRQTPTDPFVPGVFPWDPPVSNVGQSVATNAASANSWDYSISLNIVKTVTKVSVSFGFPVPVTAVAVQTDGWTVSFDGTVANATLDKKVLAGTALKVTLRIDVAAGSTFAFPSVLNTSCVFTGNPEAQTFTFTPSPGAQPTGAQPTPAATNFISTAGQSLSGDGAGNWQFTFTFKPFRALDNLSVKFVFPNTDVKTVSASAGATATFENGAVTVTYAAVPADTVSTTVTVTTSGDLNLPNQFTFTTQNAGVPQTQAINFSPSPAGPTSAPHSRKPLGFSHLSHGIKAGRAYLELAYYLEITAGSDLDSYFVEFALPLGITSAAGDATTTATLTAESNTLKLASTAPLAKGAKATLTAYLKVTTYSVVLPAALDFHYTVAGAPHHTKVKFTK